MGKAITVLGGGISGLACAYYLGRMMPEAEITLLEKAPVLGGKIRTHKVGDFVVEAGPDSFVSHRPLIGELCRELGLESRLTRSRGELAATYVWDKGQLVALPPGLHMGIPSRPWTVLMSPLLSPWGKLRLAVEALQTALPDSGDESVGSFIRRRLGREALEKLVGPLSAGIFATDPEQLSLQTTFPHLASYEKTYGSLTKALWKAPQPSSGSAFQTFKGGMQELVDRITEEIRGQIHLSVEVDSISRAEGIYTVRSKDGRSWESSSLVLAVPSSESAALMKGIDPDIAQGLEGLGLSSAAAVHLGFAREKVTHPLRGFGFVSSYPSSNALVACTWSSQKFLDRAPDNSVLLRAFFRSPSIDEVSSAALIAQAVETLRPLLGIAGEPTMSRVQRYPQAFPEYRVGYLDRIASLNEERSRHPGLYWVGPAFGAGGIPECVQQAKKVAEELSRVPATC